MKYILAKLRDSKGLTQRELAEELNLSPSTVALYELGLRTPRLQTAKKIAQYFGVPLEDIIFGPSACNLQTDAQTTNLDATGTE